MIELFTKQRRETGTDWLMTDEQKAYDYLSTQVNDYNKDSSRVFRDYAANFMYNKLYRAAIFTSWYAIKEKPFMVVNYRTFFYCLRKSLLK